LSRTSCRYSSRRTVAPELLADLRQQAMERPRFGYRSAGAAGGPDAQAQGVEGEPQAGAAAAAGEWLAGAATPAQTPRLGEAWEIYRTRGGRRHGQL